MYHAHPLEDDIFQWHFTIRGPTETAFENGIYHGRIHLPNDYPLAPPAIYFYTPNGRFAVNTKICLSISSYHPETWNPAWGIRLMLEALISFLPTKGEGAVGALDYSDEERKKLAIESQAFKCPHCGPIKALIPEVSSEKASERSAKYMAEISSMHVHGIATNSSSSSSAASSVVSTTLAPSASSTTTVPSSVSSSSSAPSSSLLRTQPSANTSTSVSLSSSSSLLSSVSTSNTASIPFLPSSSSTLSTTNDNNGNFDIHSTNPSSSSKPKHHHHHRSKHRSSKHQRKYRSSDESTSESYSTDNDSDLENGNDEEDDEDIELPSVVGTANNSRSTTTTAATTTKSSVKTYSTHSSRPIPSRVSTASTINTPLSSSSFEHHHPAPLPVHPLPAAVTVPPTVIQQRVQQMERNVQQVYSPPFLDSALEHMMSFVTVAILILLFRKLFGIELPNPSSSEL